MPCLNPVGKFEYTSVTVTLQNLRQLFPVRFQQIGRVLDNVAGALSGIKTDRNSDVLLTDSDAGNNKFFGRERERIKEVRQTIAVRIDVLAQAQCAVEW